MDYLCLRYRKFIAIITILLQALDTFLNGSVLVILLNLLVLILGLIVWLLLLPNAGYLITKLNFNHRDHDPVEVPLWYDIVGILTLAMSGIMTMCFNVFFIQFIFSVFLQPYVQNITFLFGWQWADQLWDLFRLLRSGQQLGYQASYAVHQQAEGAL